jgi:hypothetical protein
LPPRQLNGSNSARQFIGSKFLKKYKTILGEMVERLQRHNELRCDAATRKKLVRLSAATIDRLLRSERQKYQLKGCSHTRPGTLLKHQIPMRTFNEWDDEQPGFLEIDLVGHDGGVIDSLHAFTLNAVDIASGWNSSAALKNKAQVWTLEGVEKIRAKLPFPLLGIDSDNGSEFINESLYSYCQEHKITFTRSRPYRKNDSCFVEQKQRQLLTGGRALLENGTLRCTKPNHVSSRFIYEATNSP